MEEQARTQETARQAQEAGRRTQQRARESANDATRVAGQLASLSTETLAVWADVGQRAMRDVMELSAHATQEGARQLTEWQQMNADALRELQTAAFRWPALWPEAFRDPIRWYQRSLEESIDVTQRAFELARRNAETTMHTCQRLERAASDTTRTLGETFRDASTRMQDVYARSDRLHAA
jgi:hypothetical protein